MGVRTVLGVVKWFDNAKGYGFVVCPDVDGDVFAHYSAIQAQGYRTLAEGQTVRFDLTEGPKGWMAANVTVLP